MRRRGRWQWRVSRGDRWWRREILPVLEKEELRCRDPRVPSQSDVANRLKSVIVNGSIESTVHRRRCLWMDVPMNANERGNDGEDGSVAVCDAVV